MKNSLLKDFIVDKKTNTVIVKREFEAELPLVWKAWTEADLLDRWWAPKPWLSKTRSMEFREGGRRLYAMLGPAGEEHWAVADFTMIIKEKSFSCIDAFTDEKGNINADWPRSEWQVTFSRKGSRTLVEITIRHKCLADLEKTIEMGFKEGFIMALENLDEVLAGRQ